MTKPTIESLTKAILKFRNDRDWKQFHTPKDMAISLSLEASEVLEHFQWKNSEETNNHIISNKEEIADELADVMNWVLLMSNDFDIDILQAIERKIKKNEKKYPIEKAKGKHIKHDKL